MSFPDFFKLTTGFFAQDFISEPRMLPPYSCAPSRPPWAQRGFCGGEVISIKAAQRWNS